MHAIYSIAPCGQTADIENYARLTRAKAVDRLLAETRRHAAYQRNVDRKSTNAFTALRRQGASGMLAVIRGSNVVWRFAPGGSPKCCQHRPLTEKTSLFWHNHFATSAKVRSARLMYRQNVLLRSYAPAISARLLREISKKDPAMLVYLDGAQNRKGAPNENFARELMELFTLGEGQYNEADIKEVARAFTGWSWSRRPVIPLPSRHPRRW